MEVIILSDSISVDEIVNDLTVKYGAGLGQLYMDGWSAGFTKAKLDDARKFFAEGLMRKIIFRCTGISIDQIKDFERSFKAPHFYFAITLCQKI